MIELERRLAALELRSESDKVERSFGNVMFESILGDVEVGRETFNEKYTQSQKSSQISYVLMNDK